MSLNLDWRALLPFVLVVIDLIQAVVCVGYKDWARCLYWVAAALITLASVFMKG